jgi:lysozyme
MIKPSGPAPAPFRRSSGLLALLLVAGALPACGADPTAVQTARPSEVCGDGPTLFGIDVSKWQGSIDWDAVAADGVVFAFIRVSDGIAYPDSYFDINWSEAKRVGIIRGAYQFFRPGADAIAQADLLLDAMGPLETGDLPPVADVEATDSQTAATIVSKLHQWMDHVEAALGVTPFIYTGKYFWQDNVASSDFVSYPLWHAQYTSAACPNIANQWSDWVIWQYTSSGSVDGISGNVDCNRWNGDLASLATFQVGDPVCGDGSCNGDETHATCPGDCPICENIPAAGRIVDETDICFEAGGPAQYWREVTTAGHGGRLLWTMTTDDQEYNFAKWWLTFDEGGDYRVEVYTDTAYAQSHTAPYEIVHAGVTDTVIIDQAAVNGWQSLGDITFAAGGAQHVKVPDFTGVDGLQLVADALRLTRLDPVTDPDAGVPDGGVVGPDAGPGPDGGGPQPDGSVASDAATTGQDGGSTGEDHHWYSGCGCRASGSPDAGIPLLLLVGLLLGWLRRKPPR